MNNDTPQVEDVLFAKEAFNIAMAELAERHREAAENARLKEAVVTAIMDLVSAGQRDPKQLARYAVSRSHYIP